MTNQDRERADLTPRVCRILSDVIAADIEPDRDTGRSLRDLGLSSLRMIQLIGDLEEGLDVRIRDDEIGEDNFGTLGDLIRFLERKIFP